MDDFGKISYNLLLDFFSKSSNERNNYDFSQDCSKLIELFNKIPGEPLDDIDYNQISLKHINEINKDDDLINTNSDDIESDEYNSDLNILIPPVPVDSQFRKLFPHVSQCYDQLASGEIHLDGDYDDINDMWNEASVACLVTPAEFDRTKSNFTQSLVEYLMNSNQDKSNVYKHKDIDKLLNLMSWYFAGYYTAKLEK